MKITRLFFVGALRKCHLHSPPKRKPNKLNIILRRCTFLSKAFLLFRRVWRKGIGSTDSFTYLLMLKTCTRTPSVVTGRQIHKLMVNLGYERIIFLQTSLLGMYSVTGNIQDAHQVFEEIPQKNVICWTALISAYVENRKPRKALELFRQMQMENVVPDLVTVTIAISACADSGALEVGEWIHAFINRSKGFKIDLSLSNALIDMYAKCGDIKASRQLFDGLITKDITTWTSMIVGHAIHGQAEEALKLFAKLEESNPRTIPNGVTFIGVLMACSHAGLVEQGLQHLDRMNKKYGLRPCISHYGCIVDLFCRAGLLEEALAFIRQMPIQPSAVIWRTLLAASSQHVNIELGLYAQRRLLALKPSSHVNDNITVANTYAAAGFWAEKSMTREQITGQRRIPGCSLIELDNRIHEFVAADGNHPQRDDIYDILDGLLKNSTTYFGIYYGSG
ncbi:putative pentatricopeptide repeat-containing protein At1g74400 [Aristolochia californica]|uniref:putative pentatricopeptide repeat-containing protein At1g74400 n=1 Tax=Aristolochia californica TaxID=171875 RepID=UPI0035D82076